MIKNIENSTFTLRTIANKYEDRIPKAHILIPTADLKLTPMQWQSKITNNIIENLPDVLKVLVSNEHGALSGKKLPDLVSFLENSQSVSLNKAAEELKQTGRISSLGSKLDFQDYVVYKSFMKEMKNNDSLDLKILKNKYSLSDEQLELFFPENSANSLLVDNLLIDELLDVLTKIDSKARVSEIFIKKLFKDENYLKNLISDNTGRSTDCIRKIVKAVGFVNKDQQEKFIQALPALDSKNLDDGLVISRLLGDDDRRKILEHPVLSDILQNKTCSESKKDLIELIKTIKNSDLLQKSVELYSQYLCHNDFFNFFIDKKPQMLKEIFYKTEQIDGCLTKELSSDVLKKLFDDDEKIEIIKRMVSEDIIPENLIEAVENTDLVEKIIIENHENKDMERFYYLIKDKKIRNELTEKFFKEPDYRAFKFNDGWKYMLKNALDKSNDIEYVKIILDHISVSSNLSDVASFDDLEFLKKIENEEILEKIIPIFYDIYTNVRNGTKQTLKYILENVHDNKIRSNIAESIIVPYEESKNDHKLIECCFAIKYLKDDQEKIKYLNESINIINSGRFYSSNISEITDELLLIVKSLKNPDSQNDFTKRISLILNKKSEDNLRESLENMAKFIQNKNPEKFKKDDIYSQVASRFSSKEIPEECVIYYLLTANKPENLIKTIKEADILKSHLQTSRKQSLIPGLKIIEDKIAEGKFLSNIPDLKEVIEIIKQSGIDVGKTNLNEELTPKIQENIILEINFAQDRIAKNIKDLGISFDDVIKKIIQTTDKKDIPVKMLELKTMYKDFDESFDKIKLSLDNDLLVSINEKLADFVNLEDVMKNCETVEEFVNKYPQFNVNSVINEFSDHEEDIPLKLEDLIITDKTLDTVVAAIMRDLSKTVSLEKPVFNTVSLLGLGNAYDMLKKLEIDNFLEFNEGINNLFNSLSFNNIKNLGYLLNTKGINADNAKTLINIVHGYIGLNLKKNIDNKLLNIIENQKQNIPVKDIYDEAGKDFFNAFIDKTDVSIEGLARRSEVSKKWDFRKFAGLGFLYKQCHYNYHADCIKQLVRTSFDNNYEKILFDEKMEIGKINLESKKIFKELGLDFDQWMSYDVVSDIFSYKSDLNQQLLGIQLSINEDIGNLLNSSVGSDIKKFIDSLKIDTLEEKTNVIFKNNKLQTIKGEELSGDMLHSFLSKFSLYMSGNNKSGNSKWAILTKNGESIDPKDHFKERVKELKSLKSTLKNNTKSDLTASLWTRNPEKDLFIGDDCQCCISPTGINGEAIIDSLMHVVDQSILLKDQYNNVVGKAKVLWIKDITNGDKPALLVNGFEMSAGYKNSKIIREKMTEFIKGYAKKVASGQEKIKIYTGKSYQKVPIDDLEDANIEASLIGKVCDNIYHLDSFRESENGQGSWPNGLDNTIFPLKLKVLGEV